MADLNLQFVINLRVPVADEKGTVTAENPAQLTWYSLKTVDESVRDQYKEEIECVLCGSCTASCPSYWWNNDVYLGPAAMVQSWRWLWEAHNDKETFQKKLKQLTNGHVDVEFCHNIGNCTQVCPKNINVDRVMSGFRMLASLN
eukprot:NODE_5776_length_553_cov_42.164683_g5036_i0.p1 GENE.NODE_5776_length_553_cov_42.164683_g5036_i0~~NODE_5776_length_553_cov_42.164683_g5036_i0.p1  ORF type:complete len:144 (+),score=26.22 NODE_5776_length_553_cov_42.164683_g5036_i0:52-483(+)